MEAYLEWPTPCFEVSGKDFGKLCMNQQDTNIILYLLDIRKSLSVNYIRLLMLDWVTGALLKVSRERLALLSHFCFCRRLSSSSLEAECNLKRYWSHRKRSFSPAISSYQIWVSSVLLNNLANYLPLFMDEVVANIRPKYITVSKSTSAKNVIVLITFVLILYCIM